MVGNLLRALQKEKVIEDADRVVWLMNTGDVYPVRQAYKILQPCSDFQFLSKGMWVPSVPPKSALFACEATSGRS